MTASLRALVLAAGLAAVAHGCNLDFAERPVALPDGAADAADDTAELSADLGTDDDASGNDATADAPDMPSLDTEPSPDTMPDTIAADMGCDAAEATCGCEPGRADCDGLSETGCEAVLAEDPAHCGACGRGCGALELCAAGACVPCPGAERCGLCRGAEPTCDASDPALVACWTFDEDRDTQVLDASANGNHGMALAVSYRAGVEGLALALDGGGGVAVPWDASFTPAQPPQHTLDAWVQLDALPAPGARMAVLDQNGVYGIFVTAEHFVCTSNLLADAVGGKPETGVWTHVACVRDGESAVLYVDGREVAQAGYDGIGGGDPMDLLAIGANSPEGNDRLVGAIDSLRVRHRALDGGELCLEALP